MVWTWRLVWSSEWPAMTCQYQNSYGATGGWISQTVFACQKSRHFLQGNKILSEAIRRVQIPSRAANVVQKALISKIIKPSCFGWAQGFCFYKLDMCWAGAIKYLKTNKAFNLHTAISAKNPSRGRSRGDTQNLVKYLTKQAQKNVSIGKYPHILWPRCGVRVLGSR